MTKTLDEYRTQASEIIRRIGVQSLGAGLFGGSAMDTARDALAMELQNEREAGRREGLAERPSRRKKS